MYHFTLRASRMMKEKQMLFQAQTILFWNETFTFSTYDENDVLIIFMYDNDEKLMDPIEFPVSEWTADNSVNKKIDIKLNMKDAGQLDFEVQALPYEMKFFSSKVLENVKINWELAGNSVITIKLFMIGISCSGQTLLMHRFTENVFRTDLCATVGIDFGNRDIFIDDHKVKLRIFDMTGAERFRDIANLIIIIIKRKK